MPFAKLIHRQRSRRVSTNAHNFRVCTTPFTILHVRLIRVNCNFKHPISRTDIYLFFFNICLSLINFAQPAVLQVISYLASLPAFYCFLLSVSIHLSIYLSNPSIYLFIFPVVKISIEGRLGLLVRKVLKKYTFRYIILRE